MVGRPIRKPVTKISKFSRSTNPAREDRLRSAKLSENELLNALNGTAQSARKSWLFFAALVAYLFVAIASVTHIDLLLNTPIKLPILQIDIALGTFFIVAPVLFILVHFGVLLHHMMLSHKATALNESLRMFESDNSYNHHSRLIVSSYFFAQNEAGPDYGITWRILLGTMTFATFIFLPLCLLLYFQIAYLPVHDADTTAYQQFYLLIDILIILVVATTRSQLHLRNWTSSWELGRFFSANVFLSVLFCASSLFLSFTTAVLPAIDGAWDGRTDGYMTELLPTRVPFDGTKQDCERWRGDRCAFWLTAFMFEQPIDYVSGRRPWFSRNLVVTDKQLTSLSPRSKGAANAISLRGRDLRYATFDRSDLKKVDFTAADLTGASLKGADLREADFGCATRGKQIIVSTDDKGASHFLSQDIEDCPKLVGADLSEATLTAHSIRRAVLTGVILKRTNLTNWNLSNIDLSMADLSDATLRSTNFSEALLIGADLSNANAEGAVFAGASLRAANLTNAKVAVADFQYADLSGASLSFATLYGANFFGAILFGADLSQARVWQTVPSFDRAYTLANFTRLQMQVPEDLADLREALNILKGFRSDGAAASKFSRSGLESDVLDTQMAAVMDSKKRGEWKSSKDIRAWQALLASANLKPSTDRNIGDYLGELACSDETVFFGISRTYFKDDYSFSAGTREPKDVILPPGVLAADVRHFTGDYDGFSSGGEGCCGGAGSLPYRYRPELVSALYDRARQTTCKSTKSIPPAIVEELGKKLERAKERAVEKRKGATAKRANPTITIESQ
jgi:uncharacterized protein YjbI with pentapeptide repeats